MACTEACPVAALRPIGKWLSVEDCMAQIREDVVFYGKSGGGVTLSGGEVLMQKAFAQALLQRCHAEGIHTAERGAATKRHCAISAGSTAGMCR